MIDLKFMLAWIQHLSNQADFLLPCIHVHIVHLGTIYAVFYIEIPNQISQTLLLVSNLSLLYYVHILNKFSSHTCDY